MVRLVCNGAVPLVTHNMAFLGPGNMIIICHIERAQELFLVFECILLLDGPQDAQRPIFDNAPRPLITSNHYQSLSITINHYNLPRIYYQPILVGG